MARISKIYRMIFVALLALLGFSCSRWFVAEYGAPHATYKAKGIVVSEADETPIEGIQANFHYYYIDIDYEEEMYFHSPITTTYTNSNGAFSLEARYSDFSRKLLVELVDVDGETNGSFERMVIEADFTDKTFTGGSGWYRGQAEINLGIIKMKSE